MLYLSDLKNKQAPRRHQRTTRGLLRSRTGNAEVGCYFFFVPVLAVFVILGAAPRERSRISI